MPAFNQHVPASETVNDFGRSPRVIEGLNLDPRQLLRFMNVRRDHERQRNKLVH